MNANQKPLINTPKKSSDLFGNALKIIAIICLLCCMWSMFNAYIDSKTGRGEPRGEPRDAPKPVIRDMEVIDMSSKSSFQASTEEVKGENVSKKSAKIGVYNNCDCESDEVQVVQMSSGADLKAVGEIEIDEKDQWKCVKGENVTLKDYAHAFTGVRNGESVNGNMNLDSYNIESPIKVGCEAGENFVTTKLKFKWNVRE
jgi:hypothetical protein